MSAKHLRRRLRDLVEPLACRWAGPFEAILGDRMNWLMGDYRGVRAIVNARFDREVGHGDSKDNIVIFTSVGGLVAHLAFELSVFRELQRRGIQPVLVFAGDLWNWIELLPARSDARERARLARKLERITRTALAMSGIQWIHGRDVLDDAAWASIGTHEARARKLQPEEVEGFAIDDVAVGPHAMAATLRFLRRGTFPLVGDPDRALGQEALAGYLQASIRCHALAAGTIRTFRPSKALMTHGIYASWGPARAAFAKAGVPVAVYDRSAVFGDAWVTSWNAPSQTMDSDATFRDEAGLGFEPAERAEIESYLLSRRSNSADRVCYNPSQAIDGQEVRRSMGIPPEALFVGVFPNLLWDGAVVGREGCFPNQVEWLRAIVDFYLGRPESHVVIRPHPAEELRGTAQSVMSEVRALLGGQCRNVHLIERPLALNAYSVFEAVDAGLVNNSSVGLELAALGKPVVTASQSHYRGKGFTLDPRSPDDFRRALEALCPGARLPEEARSEALRYAHLHYVRHHFPLPFLRVAREANRLDAVEDPETSEGSRTLMGEWMHCFLTTRPFVLSRASAKTQTRNGL